MAAAWAYVRATSRHRLGGVLALVLIVGIGGGLAIGAANGARRTHTAVERFKEQYRSPDAGVDVIDPAVVDELVHLPEVEAAFVGAFMLFATVDENGNGDPSRSVNVVSEVVPTDRPLRPLLLEGRFPDPSSPEEVSIDEAAAAALDLGIGSTLQVRAFTPEEEEGVFSGGDVQPDGPIARLRVTAITRRPVDLTVEPDPGDVVWLGDRDVVPTPAFFERYQDEALFFGPGLEVSLRNGREDFPAFEKAARPLIGEEGFIYAETDDDTAAREAQRATRLESLALWVLAGLALVATLVIGGQSVARQVHLDGAARPSLRAIGMSRRDLSTVGALRVTVAIIAGTAFAIGVAVVGSPLTPIGLARQAEVDPGVFVDVPVVAIGAVALLVLCLGRALIATWSSTRTRRGATTEVAVADKLAAVGVPPAGVAGVRMAFHGTATTGLHVPVGLGLAGAVASLVAVTAAIAFGASLDRVVADESLSGWRWDAMVGNPHSPDLSDSMGAALAARDDIDVTPTKLVGVRLADGAMTSALVGIERPSIVPLRSGRYPEAADEVALGGRMMRELDLELGDTITLVAEEAEEPSPVTLKIVGSVVLNPLTANGQIDLGAGGLVTPEGATAVWEEAPTNQFLVRAEQRSDRDAVVASLREEFRGNVLTAVRVADVENLRRVGRLPDVFAATLALLAVGTMAHTLLTSLRRRRRELAVLKTLGFSRRQVASTIAWQGFAFGLVALVVGVPLGVGLGRWSWMLVEDALTIDAGPRVPLLALAAVVAATLGLIALVATGPAIAAGRTRPALVLRAE